MLDGCDVRRGVEKRAVLLADDERRLLFAQRFGCAIDLAPEDAHGSVVLTGDASLEKVVDHAGKRVVVGALAEPHVERHVELGIHRVEAALG